MAETAKHLVTPVKQTSNNELTFSQKADKRKANELIIGLCGPIGSGVRVAAEQLKIVLEEAGYDVHHIRLSELMISFVEENERFSQFRVHIPAKNISKYDRYTNLQDLGNALRESIEFGVVANLAAKEISTLRKTQSNDEQEPEKIALKKKAYILDQLKHHEEVSTLKKIYGNLFYLIGTLCSERVRLSNLEKEKINPECAKKLVLIDKNQNLDHGQKLEKTILRSDFFIGNNKGLLPNIKAELTRCLNLLHGVNGITPRTDEYGMYSAYSASLQSACLSRQVGAAILDKSGSVLSIGKNDVPKKGGGLYSANDSSSEDHRCVNMGYCSNDKYKKILIDDISELISSHVDDKEIIGKIVDGIKENEQIRSLIEYSRSIHAEMDALISLVQRGEKIQEGSSLYTTTFPCHNCARHIIASGISRIVYIEPYEKSLAMKLHDDALTIEEGDINKVFIEPFQGVSPSKYQLVFSANGGRKDKAGKAIHEPASKLLQIDNEYVDSYIDIEAKSVQHLVEKVK